MFISNKLIKLSMFTILVLYISIDVVISYSVILNILPLKIIKQNNRISNKKINFPIFCLDTSDCPYRQYCCVFLDPILKICCNDPSRSTEYKQPVLIPIPIDDY